MEYGGMHWAVINFLTPVRALHPLTAFFFVFSIVSAAACNHTRL